MTDEPPICSVTVTSFRQRHWRPRLAMSLCHTLRRRVGRGSSQCWPNWARMLSLSPALFFASAAPGRARRRRRRALLPVRRRCTTHASRISCDNDSRLGAPLGVIASASTRTARRGARCNRACWSRDRVWCSTGRAEFKKGSKKGRVDWLWWEWEGGERGGKLTPAMACVSIPHVWVRFGREVDSRYSRQVWNRPTIAPNQGGVSDAHASLPEWVCVGQFSALL